MRVPTELDDIVFVITMPLTENNNVVTYNVAKAGLRSGDTRKALCEAIEAQFPGIEGVEAKCYQNPDWHTIMRERNHPKPKKRGFFHRIFSR